MGQHLKTIILAAGKGTRMVSETPKVLHPVGGVPILQRVIRVAQAVGSLKIVTVLGHKSQVVRAILEASIGVVKQEHLLGTADAVKCTQAHFNGYTGDILILCGDTPLLNKGVIKRLIRTHQRKNVACTVLTACLDHPFGYGRMIRDAKGFLKAIREEKDATDAEKLIQEINVGVYCFKAKALFEGLKHIQVNAKKKEFYLTDIVAYLSEKEPLATVQTPNAYEGLGVNCREDLAVAEGIVRQQTLLRLMRKGVTIVDPQTTYIAEDARVGKDTTIYPCSVIEANVRVGPRCSIGPFARLRAGTRLAQEVVIGNFTEVSRTQIGPKSLMKHFSYLGDAVLGSEVNVGAGAVTANFDGKAKHTTRIGDQAFIGSDAVLISPVKVGAQAVVGAGSVVTKGKIIPSGGMAVGVPAIMKTRRRNP